MDVATEALPGIRVADFSWAMAGPYCTSQLALLGAEVIKIESVSRLDITRAVLDPLTSRYWPPDRHPMHAAMNLNKLGIRLNLARPEAVALAKRLVSISDVAVQSFAPGVMDRLGLGYEALREVRPDLVMLSTSFSGSTGPEAQYRAYAPMFAAIGGLGELTGYPDGLPTEIRHTVDAVSALTNALAILAALSYRQRTGEGQHIDTSSRESVTCLLGDSLMEYIMNGGVQTRNGNGDDIMAPHNCYRCQGEDKWVSIAVATDEEWQALCQALGKPDLAREERFADSYSRWQNQEELDKLIEEWTKSRTSYEVMDILQRAGVAAMPSFNSQEMFTDPGLHERGVFCRANHTELGELAVVAPPWRLSATPARVKRAGPLLGEHNQYVFGKLLGLSREEIVRLEEQGVIY